MRCFLSKVRSCSPINFLSFGARVGYGVLFVTANMVVSDSVEFIYPASRGVRKFLVKTSRYCVYNVFFQKRPNLHVLGHTVGPKLQNTCFQQWFQCCDIPKLLITSLFTQLSLDNVL